MTFARGFLKRHTTDKYLAPIRQQMCYLVEPNKAVIDVGCGSGDLLFRLSKKIDYGIGIDRIDSLISFARRRKQKLKIQNLEFRIDDALKIDYSDLEADCAVLSLFLHTVPWQDAKRLLTAQLAAYETVIICGFSSPPSMSAKTLLFFDQRFTGHYRYFKQYQRHNYTEGLLKELGCVEYKAIRTFDPVLKIFVIN